MPQVGNGRHQSEKKRKLPWMLKFVQCFRKLPSCKNSICFTFLLRPKFPTVLTKLFIYSCVQFTLYRRESATPTRPSLVSTHWTPNVQTRHPTSKVDRSVHCIWATGRLQMHLFVDFDSLPELHLSVSEILIFC